MVGRKSSRVDFAHLADSCAFPRITFAITFALAVMHVIRERGGMSIGADPKLNMSEAA